MSEQLPPTPETQTTVPPSVTPDAQPAPVAAPAAAPAETQAVAPAYLDNGEQKMTLSEAQSKYGNTFCPYCNVGVRVVQSFDPDAKHELDQPIYFPNELSGGHVGVLCLSCGKTESLALNPRPGPPAPPKA